MFIVTFVDYKDDGEIIDIFPTQEDAEEYLELLLDEQNEYAPQMYLDIQDDYDILECEEALTLKETVNNGISIYCGRKRLRV
jgi:hypothetical protein